MDSKEKSAQAEAALKLGLLNYKLGGNAVKISVDYLLRHFELARQDENKKSKKIDAARVNIGIAQGNIAIEKYQKLVLNDLPSLLEWKIKRNMKK